MTDKSFRVAGVGCSLADFLYANVDFESEGFKRHMSKKPGDGGLVPGHLVFLEDLEKFAGEDFKDISKRITGNQKPDAFNIGGPAVVAMINAAQLLAEENIEIDFYGVAGNDDIADRIFSIIEKTPLKTTGYKRIEGMTPFTEVLSDPNYSDGKGERTFINNIGAVWSYAPEDLDDNFFNANIVLFGGTALLPNIHDSLTQLLEKGKEKGCLNIVTTVFDFRNENKNPGKRWPLGDSDKSFEYMDLLVVDHAEALKISGEESLDKSVKFFKDMGLTAFIITNGAKNITAYSDGKVFKKLDIVTLPVSGAVDKELELNPERKGDTTGCGDNFAGGVLASTADQLRSKGKGNIDLIEACAWGAASGGFACFYIGGTYIEKTKSEKLSHIRKYFLDYAEQIKKIHKIDADSMSKNLD